MFRPLLLFILTVGFLSPSNAQDSLPLKARVDLPLFEWPQNQPEPYAYPSLNQALGISYSAYQLSFWGLHAGIHRLIVGKNSPVKPFKKWLNRSVNYAAQLAFCRYASELPIPLGVWAHEEYHRAVLKTAGINSHNGNWLFNRWDGTVYGPSDEELSRLKKEQLPVLLYSYVAGVQSETALTDKISKHAFVSREEVPKAALILYNSYYVFNYFKFSASAMSDSVKRLAPLHEAKKAEQRDFAGADLTAWVYDMMSPDSAYTLRSAFPGGEGVNRRVGMADLSEEGRAFLKQQKQLALLNFLHPGILGVSRIRLSHSNAFLPYLTYYPTHFGNMIAATVLVKINQHYFSAAFQQYAGRTSKGYGLQLSVLNYTHHHILSSDLQLSLWQQPHRYDATSTSLGGALQWKLFCKLSDNLQAYLNIDYKSSGWLLNNPYLQERLSAGIGLAATFY